MRKVTLVTLAENQDKYTTSGISMSRKVIWIDKKGTVEGGGEGPRVLRSRFSCIFLSKKSALYLNSADQDRDSNRNASLL